MSIPQSRRFAFTQTHDIARKATGSSSRTRTAEETLALLLSSRLASQFGITRVANITQLDDIGLPVWQAIRPNARSLSVAQGKGSHRLDHVGAKVSAIMESLEAYHAEHARCPLRIETRRALAREAEVVDATRLPLASTGDFHDDLAIPWALAHDLFTGEPFYVPFEIVHSNFTVPRTSGSGHFRASSNGMGAGNHPAEAVLQGLCELVERDAEALFSLNDDGDDVKRASRVALASVDDDEARALLALLDRAGIATMIWDMTSDIRLPCFSVVIFDLSSDPDLNPRPAAEGSGCHFDRGAALCRALTEAMQSRLTSIAGSRDDLSSSRYSVWQSRESLAHWRAQVNEPAERMFDVVPTASSGATVDSDLALVVDRLRERGLDRIAWVDLSSPRPLLALTFARTIVPGLEGSLSSPSYKPGARALSKMGI